jgi:hypothetical protein
MLVRLAAPILGLAALLALAAERPPAPRNHRPGGAPPGRAPAIGDASS